METPPQTLVVVPRHDDLIVTLGPSKGIVAWGGLVTTVLSVWTAVALTSFIPLAAGVVAGLGISAGAAQRVRGWVRYEAPLELVVGPRVLELRRVFRGRLLRLDTLVIGDVSACEATAAGLRLTTSTGVIGLRAGHRSQEELAWVVRLVLDAAAQAQEVQGNPEARGAIRQLVAASESR